MRKMLELWLFTFLVKSRLITQSFMNRWLNRISNLPTIYTGTLYINSSLWGAKLMHPKAKIALNVDEVLRILGKDEKADIIYIGTYTEITKMSLKIIGMKEIFE